MKRQERIIDGTGSVGRKKRKRAAETKEEDGVVKNGDGETAVALTLESVLWREEWAWLRGGVVDEQMSWSWGWSPLWDVDFVDKAYSAFFSDVAWDDDIWNLRDIMAIPNQSNRAS